MFSVIFKIIQPTNPESYSKVNCNRHIVYMYIYIPILHKPQCTVLGCSAVLFLFELMIRNYRSSASEEWGSLSTAGLRSIISGM